MRYLIAFARHHDVGQLALMHFVSADPSVKAVSVSSLLAAVG